MKTLIVILIIAAFLQTTVVPIDLVLLILICRAYIINEKENLYLAFAFGLLTSHLGLVNLGLHSLVYLVIVQVVQVLSKSNLAGNSLVIIPISLVLLYVNQFVNSLFSYTTLGFFGVIIASFLSLPILYLVRMWEERFITRKEIKLKV